jgi:hypothetical protein
MATPPPDAGRSDAADATAAEADADARGSGVDAGDSAPPGAEASAEAGPDAPAPPPSDTGPPASEASTACDDDVKDGDETDVDCGGSCPPCGRGQQCRVPSDCGSSPGCDVAHGGCACDEASGVCVADHCSDGMMDSSETDVDCGGPDCAGCGPRKGCAVDSDCSATLSGCDAQNGGCTCDALSMTCVYDHCYDHKKDSSETDVDCGGGACAVCTTGQGCLLDFDCASEACDGVSSVCVVDPCNDHRQDGMETDSDCGGNDVCLRCAQGEKCNSNTDCQAGLVCSTTLPHVCE